MSALTRLAAVDITVLGPVVAPLAMPIKCPWEMGLLYIFNAIQYCKAPLLGVFIPAKK